MVTWLQKVLLLEFVQSDSTETQRCGKRRSSLTQIVFFLRTAKDAIHIHLFLSLLGHGTASVGLLGFMHAKLKPGPKFRQQRRQKRKSESLCYTMEAEKSATNHNDTILSQRQKCSPIPCGELTPQFVSLTFCCCFYC